MLSKKTQYVFNAVMYIGQMQNVRPILISDIASKKKVPTRFLENILLELKHAGILDSKRSRNGGYFFKEDPSSISLAKIMRLLDGPIALLPCVSLNFYERCKSCDETNCPLHDTLLLTRDATLKILEMKTVADLF
ncbi:MAG: Rrf2 family transcriptional regulator [Agriterribacter sp.]